MPVKLLDVDTFRSAAKDGHAPEGAALFKFGTTEPEVVGGARSRTRRFVFSDATVDHSDDSIDPKGWDLSVFKRNPVALFSHMSSDPPIGRASNVSAQNNQLVGDIEFADADTYEFADTIFRLVAGGFLKAVSVGFIPKKWAFSSDKNRPFGIDFKEQLLVEISICPVPCNPNALGEARSLGVDTRPLGEWAERVLDGGDSVFLPRRDLESLRSQAGIAARRRTVRSASPSSHPLMKTIEDVGASIGATRAAIKDVQRVLDSPDEPKLDEVQLKLAVGHFSGAIASKNVALACLRAALASADDNAEEVTGNPSEPRNPGDPGARSVAERLREANELRRSCAAETPEERRRYAADLRRTLSAPTQTVGERVAQVRQIRRELDV